MLYVVVQLLLAHYLGVSLCFSGRNPLFSEVVSDCSILSFMSFVILALLDEPSSSFQGFWVVKSIDAQGGIFPNLARIWEYFGVVVFAIKFLIVTFILHGHIWLTLRRAELLETDFGGFADFRTWARQVQFRVSYFFKSIAKSKIVNEVL